MTLQPLYQFFAGIFFAAVSLLFLWQAFKKKEYEDLHYDIVHFVCALCAGAAGAFFTGSALLWLEIALDAGGKFFFQATAGVALFAFVLLVFRWRFRRKVPPPPPDGAWISVGTHTPLHQAAETIAEMAGATVDLSALNPQERNAIPASAQLNCGTVELARTSLLRLGQLVPAGSVRKYVVTYDAGSKRFLISV